jgi:hypothetical protein
MMAVLFISRICVQYVMTAFNLKVTVKARKKCRIPNPIFEWISGTIVFNIEPYKKLLGLRRTRVDILDDWRDIIEAMENGEDSQV